jgi:hypothetical protein
VHTGHADGLDSHTKRDHGEDRGYEAGERERCVLGESATCHPHCDRGGRDGGSLHRLERLGERQPLAVLHHHGIRQEVPGGLFISALVCGKIDNAP